MDDLWFLAVEEEFDLEEATKLNEKVWGGLGFREAKKNRGSFRFKK